MKQTHYQIKQQLIEDRGCYCETCGSEVDYDYLELDHVQAKSLGGVNEEYNYQLKCMQCHRRKTTRDVRTKKQQNRLKNYYLS